MRALGSILLGCAVLGCSDADVAGTYAISGTNRENGCNIGGINPGASWMTDAVITQQASNVTITVQGGGGLGLGVLLGSNVFNGEVSGDEIDASILGTQSQSTGNCAYTFNATLAASIDGDAIAGRLEYRAATNGNPDCATLTGCVTLQDFNGTRPPR